MIWRVIDFFKTGVWEIRLRDLPALERIFVRALRVVLLASRRFVTDQCHKTASVLTYYSLLNIVPVVAVAFAVAKGFGLQKLIERQIIQLADRANLQPDVTDQILTFAQRLLEQAKGGLIAGVGIILLLWTVISILGKIEESLNEVWEVRRPRTLVRRFSDYVALLVFGPVLLIVSSSATVLVASQAQTIIPSIALPGALSAAILFLLNLLPYASIWALLTMLYLVMPNTRIPLKSAIVGGITAGTIAQIVQWVYVTFQIGVAGYGAIYGSFAALPLFLAWIQISWMIVLFGAEIAHASEHYETYGFHPDYSRISVSARKLLVLRVLHLLTKRFSAGEKPPSVRQVAHSLEIPARLVERILRDLSEVGLVVETAGGVKGEVTFQPGRAMENLTLKSVLDEYEKYGIARIPDSGSDDAEKISRYLGDIAEAIEKSPANVHLTEV